MQRPVTRVADRHRLCGAGTVTGGLVEHESLGRDLHVGARRGCQVGDGELAEVEGEARRVVAAGGEDAAEARAAEVPDSRGEGRLLDSGGVGTGIGAVEEVGGHGELAEYRLGAAPELVERADLARGGIRQETEPDRLGAEVAERGAVDLLPVAPKNPSTSRTSWICGRRPRCRSRPASRSCPRSGPNQSPLCSELVLPAGAGVFSTVVSSRSFFVASSPTPRPLSSVFGLFAPDWCCVRVLDPLRRVDPELPGTRLQVDVRGAVLPAVRTALHHREARSLAPGIEEPAAVGVKGEREGQVRLHLVAGERRDVRTRTSRGQCGGLGPVALINAGRGRRKNDRRQQHGADDKGE